MTLTEKGQYVILNLRWHEEAPDWGWIEGAGWLPRLIALRDDILRRDYRLLYLAWLKAVTLEVEMLDDTVEPPVPAGLRQLSPGLQTFIELFELDEHLAAAAAEASGAPESITEGQLRHAIDRLSSEERQSWLLRLAQGEPHLSATFNRQLLELLDQPSSSQKSRRSIAELYAAAERLEKILRDKRTAEARARHLKKMERLATRESQLWQEVIELIERKTGKSYDQAVAHLSDLRDLANHRGEETTFQARLNKIYQDYPTLSGLRRRLQKAKLYKL
jgi:hypothetical protein